MIRQLDHIVILVHDLEAAISDYTQLGFTVVRGGDHPGGATHNALVAFADGAYLELIAFKQPSEQHPWWKKAQQAGEGLVDYALLPEDTAAVIAAARERGLTLQGPIEGGRERPDGVRLEWQTARSSTADLPFLCSDRTPRALRVPEGKLRNHSNGATGVAGITIAVGELAASVARYQALLGDAGTLMSAPVPLPGFSLDTTGFVLRNSRITLVTPTSSENDANAAVRAQLAGRGEGPFAVAFYTNGSATGMLDQSLAHGARLELVRGGNP